MKGWTPGDALFPFDDEDPWVSGSTATNLGSCILQRHTMAFYHISKSRGRNRVLELI